MIENTKIGFVILHYQLQEMTMRCIDCLLDSFGRYDICVIVVDNASPNNSGREIKKSYDSHENVEIIINNMNEGFSKGNNIGYRRAKELGCDFIVIMNNDVEITQEDFVDQIIAKYDQTHCHVMGPDIINEKGIHQSPQRNHYITIKELKKWYKRRKHFHRLLRVARRCSMIENLLIKKYRNHDIRRISTFNYCDEQEDVELQGACIIFTPLFLKYRNDAFEEISFMYAEEPMLSVLCKSKGWHTCYNPMINVLHKEKATSMAGDKSFIDYELFYSFHLSQGLKNIIRWMENHYIR